MGHRLSRIQGSGQEVDEDIDLYTEDESQEDVEYKDEESSPAALESKRRPRRRRSSGLSRYSTDGRHVVETPIRIGAFNVRRFGSAKMRDAVVVNILVRLVRSFDILAVQEVVDSSDKAVNQLLKAVNGDLGEADGGYRVAISPRLGRNSQKEQYAIFYRSARVELLESLVYEDPGDVFIREPFIARFRSECVQADAAEFTLIAIHTQPKAAVTEIDRLADVHQFVREKFETENIVLLGDFNAGGSYVRSQDWPNIRLRRDGFNWLIPDHMDTTATNTLAAYDRIVVCGDQLMSCIVQGSAGVFRYDEEFSVEETNLIKVSDHYPVSFCLKPALHPDLARNIRARVRIIVQDRRFPTSLCHTKLAEDFKIPKYKLRTLHNADGEPVLLELRSFKLRNTDDVIKAIGNLRSSFEDFISYSQYATLKYKLESGDVKDASLNGAEPSAYYIHITADIQLKEFQCAVEMETCIA